MRHKIIHFILAAIFSLFAIVQYNDPDPVLWILIYGSVAILAALKLYMKQVNFRPLILTIIGILSLYALVHIPGFIEYLRKPDKGELFGTMIYDRPWIEQTREFLGLLLCIGSLVYLWITNRGK